MITLSASYTEAQQNLVGLGSGDITVIVFITGLVMFRINEAWKKHVRVQDLRRALFTEATHAMTYLPCPLHSLPHVDELSTKSGSLMVRPEMPISKEAYDAIGLLTAPELHALLNARTEMDIYQAEAIKMGTQSDVPGIVQFTDLGYNDLEKLRQKRDRAYEALRTSAVFFEHTDNQLNSHVEKSLEQAGRCIGRLHTKLRTMVSQIRSLR